MSIYAYINVDLTPYVLTKSCRPYHIPKMVQNTNLI